MTAALPSALKFGIIGCGLIGKKRAAALKPGQLLYACDLEASRAENLAQTAPGAQAVTDFRKVLADSRVDAVVIATMNSLLAPIALESAAAGKHVLVEKPGALDSRELRAVHAAMKKSGVVVRVGYNHRFHPALLKAREIVDSGALGPLMFLRARYGHGGRKGYDREWRADPRLSGGGELIDQGVHLIDLAGWFLGEFPTVEGHATTYFWDMKVDDNAFLSLRTSANQTAWLHVSCTEWKNLFSMELYGRNGKISVDGLGGSYGPERCTYHRMLPQMGPPETTTWESPPTDLSWAAELAAFEADVHSPSAERGYLEQDICTLEIVEKIYRKSGYSGASA